MEKIKMLVVDDIPQTRKDIIRLLYFEDDMLVIGEAGDGMEALKKIGELQPDVVLMDINMPQMDGITATERVCQLHPHVAIIIISIQGESEYLKKAMVAGARDYLVKPLGSDEMANTIRSVYKQQCMRFPKVSQVRGVVETPPTPRNGFSSEPQVGQNSYERHGQALFHEPQEQLLGSTATLTQPTHRHDQFPGSNEAMRQPSYNQGQPLYSQESLHDRNEVSDQSYSHEQLRNQDMRQQTYGHEPLRNQDMRQPTNGNERLPLRNQDMRQPTYGNERLPLRNQDMRQETYVHEPLPLRNEDMRQTSFSQEQYGQAISHSPVQAETGSETDLTQQRVQQSPVSDQKQVSQPALSTLPPEPQISHKQQPLEREAVVKESTQGEEKSLGQIFVVFCGKGGVGKTTVATNLAVALAQQEKKRVALVDYDLQFGDISVLLNLSDGKNVSDLVRGEGELTRDIVNNYMIRHFSGIDILPAPLFPQDAEYVTAEHVGKILRLLTKNYDYVIVDTAPTFDDVSLQVLDLANHILLITTRDIVTIKNTKTSLNILDTLNYREKVKVVLNRSDQDLGVEVTDLEKGLDITISHKIVGDEKAVISAINKGVPVVVSHSNSEIARSYKRMVEKMVGTRRHANGEKQSKGIITRMFSL